MCNVPAPIFVGLCAMKTHRKRHIDTSSTTTKSTTISASPRPRSRRRKQARPTRAPSKDGKDAFPPALHFRLTLGTTTTNTRTPKITIRRTTETAATATLTPRKEPHIKRQAMHFYSQGHGRRASSLGPSRSASPIVHSGEMTRSRSSDRHVQRDMTSAISNDSHLRVDISSVDMARSSSRDRNKPTHLREYVS